METNHNAKASEDRSGRRDKRFPANQQDGLGQVGGYSQIYRVENEGGSSQDDSQWTDTTDWKLYPVRDTTAGKILERIESLESRHIKYVDAHESRLNARLEAARNEKEEFLREAHQIKSDLYHLVMAEKKADGNGHIN